MLALAGRRNAIIDYSFNQPGEYAVRVEDIAGNGGRRLRLPLRYPTNKT